jgi:endoglucanase
MQVDKAAMGDGSLLIPERANGVPDVLDEARWELEFFLRMQVPAGAPQQLINGKLTDVSGMVHHKLHDNQWTPLPTDPSQDDKRRELHRPSTCATLNMVAVAAQGARLFAKYDVAFSRQLLVAARTGYAAAKAHPAVYAPGTDWDLGGGAYSDSDATDDFYWAACELYITTAEQSYLTDVMASPWHAQKMAWGFSWGQVAALGRLDLAAVPNHLPDRARVIASVLEAADQIIALQSGQAYGVPTTSFPCECRRHRYRR